MKLTQNTVFGKQLLVCFFVGANQDRRTLKNSVFARHGIAANRPKSINVNNGFIVSTANSNNPNWFGAASNPVAVAA